MAESRSGKWGRYGAYAGIGVAVLALAALAAGPLGWRAGWWHYRVAFQSLWPAAAYMGIAAIAVGALSLAVARSALGGAPASMAVTAIAIGAVVFYIPWQFRHTAGSVPRIHDITTDTDNPPVFVAALPVRGAEKANTAAYGGPELAKQQKEGYPDLAPVKATLPRDEAFKRALETAQAMPGWKVVDSDPAAGRIEANQATRWFGFVDDIVIRVAADGTGSRVDIRSVSRQGRSDLGVNAARVRAYTQALKTRLG